LRDFVLYEGGGNQGFVGYGSIWHRGTNPLSLLPHRRTIMSGHQNSRRQLCQRMRRPQQWRIGLMSRAQFSCFPNGKQGSPGWPLSDSDPVAVCVAVPIVQNERLDARSGHPDAKSGRCRDALQGSAGKM
jgi:hypothetical protein